jgi:hypothetical protein
MSAAPPQPPSPFLPAGLPPGSTYGADDKPPDAVTWFRIYAAVACALYGLVAIGGIVAMFAPLFMKPPPTEDGGALGMWILGLFYGLWGVAVTAPCLIVLFSGRRPWVHPVGVIAIGVGMFSFCCLPLLIPLFLVWMKPETKRWYGAR